MGGALPRLLQPCGAIPAERQELDRERAIRLAFVVDAFAADRLVRERLCLGQLRNVAPALDPVLKRFTPCLRSAGMRFENLAQVVGEGHPPRLGLCLEALLRSEEHTSE